MKRLGLFLAVLLVVATSGCAGLKRAGDVFGSVTGVYLNPEITWSSGGGSGTYYSDTLRYGYRWPFAQITVVNNTLYDLYFEQDGKQQFLQDQQGRRGYTAVVSAQTLNYAINVPYGTTVTTVVTTKAYKDGKFIGVAQRRFTFYGDINRNNIEPWVIGAYEIQKAEARNY